MNLQEFKEYQEKEEKLHDLMETAKYLRAESRRHMPARARNNDWELRNWKENTQRAFKNLGPVERELSALKSEVFKLRKIANLGIGEWVKEPSDGMKHIGGSSRGYIHPEFGKVSHYTFGGWSMQRVAANASVQWEFEGRIYRREWSGSTARQSSYDYLKRTFGI